ncbi:MAG: hypothetical protein GY719_27650 [bacterium]|nr:hypothetical protein [bacterium]
MIRFAQLLGLRSGEHSRFIWLFGHSLFNGICTAFLFSSAYALFLDRYDVETLPWAYIATALAGYAVVGVFARLERRLSFSRLLLVQLYSVLVFVLVSWGVARVIPAKWPVFLMFVAVGPLLTLLELEYWGIAVRLFDLRQGKRLFSLVSSGGVISSIIGFFMVPVMVSANLPLIKRFEDLLLFAAVGVVLSIMTVREIGRRFTDELEIRSSADEKREAGSFAALLGDRYFVLISTLLAVVVLAFYLIDLSFLSEVEIKFHGKGAELAAFVGKFYGIAKLLELVVKAFLSGRLVSQFGVRFGLTCLPGLLLAVIGMAILARSMGTGLELFFLLITMIKLLWLVIRKAIFDGAFKVLYQPLDSEEKFEYQARIEGTVSPSVTLAVGIGLLLHSLYSKEGFDALQLLYATLPLLVAWLVTVTLLHRQYRERLLQTLAREVDKGGTESPVETIQGRLLEATPEQFDYVSDVLARVDSTVVPQTLIDIVERGSPELRMPVLERIERTRDFDAWEAVETCSAADEPEIRAAAVSTMQTLRDLVGLASGADQLAALVASRQPEDRELAALAIGWSAGQSHGDLTGLLWDRDPDVQRAALLAAGRIRDPRFWQRVISQMSSQRYATAATAALISIGDPVLPDLEAAFGKVDQQTDVRLRILNVYHHTGGRQAGAFIVDKLRFPDKEVRLWTLVALSHSGYRPDEREIPVLKNEVENLVRRMAWNLSAILDLGESEATLEVREALEAENVQNRSELFLQLSLLHDPRAIDLVRRNLTTGNNESVVFALEILDVVVSADIKPMLFPVVEELPPIKAMKRLESWFPRQRMAPVERLGAIVFREHDAMSAWTRACALQAIAELERDEVDDVLVANVFHPEAMLQEVAAGTILQVDPEQYTRHTAKLTTDEKERIDRVIVPGHPEMASWESRSMFGKIAAMRQVKAFAGLPSEALMKIASDAEKVDTETGQAFPAADEPEGSLYVVAEGRLGLYTEGGGMGVVGARSLVAFATDEAAARVLEAGHVYRLQGSRLYELAAVSAELAAAILEAASPQVVHEVASLSRSFESAISFMPSH